MIRLLGALAVLTALLAPGPAGAEPGAGPGVEPRRGPTVVSITFDGSYRSQADAAEILAARDLAGTFYINSGYLNYPAYLTVEQVHDIARSRNEIGGASLYGNDLSRLPMDIAQREVCNDRATLAQLGFQVTSFSYPYGAATREAKAVVQDCGYNNARDYSGLRASLTGCSLCPLAESLPPRDDFRIRTGAGSTVAGMERQVRNAEVTGGGWVTLVLTGVCLCPAVKDSITPADFTAFVDWLVQRPGSTVVRTVDQVMGGPLEPVHGTALARLVPHPSAAISTEPEALSKAPAWSVLGYGIGQSEIILLGVLLSTTIVVTYRIATKGARYAS